MSTLLPVSGHTYRYLEKEEEERVRKFSGPAGAHSLHVRVNKEGWLLGENYRVFSEKFAKFKIRPTDVYVVTFEKVGTTWTQEIIWTMFFNPNLDHKDQHLPVLERSLFLDFDMMIMGELSPEKKKRFGRFFERFQKECPEGDEKLVPHLQLAETLPNPRVLKSHLALSLVPKDCLEKAKIVYVARDPRDIVTSFQHHQRILHGYQGTVDDMCEQFVNDDVINSPYWMHVKEAWQIRDHPNFHFMLYEDMKADITKELKRLDKFLGTKLTPLQIENVKQHTAFEAMKARDAAFKKTLEDKTGIFDSEIVKKEGGFFRQGKTGDGKKRLSAESLKKIDEWIKEHFDFGLNFD